MHRCRALQRQIDSGLMESANRERETDLLRQRVYALQGEKNAEAGARIAEAVDHQIQSGVPAAPPSIANQFAQYYQQPHPSGVTQPAAPAAQPHRNNLVLPSSLGAAASHDLQDVISALGGTIPASTAAPQPRARPSTAPVNNSTSSSSSGSDASSTGISRPVTQRLSFPPMGSSSIHDTSTSMSSADDAGTSSALGGVSSVEKRLKALVSTALNSPSRRK